MTMDDHENAFETYTIRSADKELHCMDVLMEGAAASAARRGAHISDENISASTTRRCGGFGASRVQGLTTALSGCRADIESDPPDCRRQSPPFLSLFGCGQAERTGDDTGGPKDQPSAHWPCSELRA